MSTPFDRREAFTLRRGVYSVRLNDGRQHLVAGDRAESFPEPSEAEAELLERLAQEFVPVEELYDFDGGCDGESGRRAKEFVQRLWNGGWLTLGVTIDDTGVAYTIEPFRPPPPRTQPPPDVLLSRFAVLHRGGNDIVVESPLSWCDIHVFNPTIAGLIAGLGIGVAPDPPDSELASRLLSDLWWGGLLVDPDGGEWADLSHRQWQTHELWFHERSRGGARAYSGGGFGGTGWARGTFAPPPARHEPPFPGRRIPLARPDLTELERTDPPLTRVLETRTSIREHDDACPLTIEDLGQFLYRCARTRETVQYEGVEYKSRPYPSGGSVYELEIYPLVRNVKGLEAGLYHYDAECHDLVLVAEDGPTTRRLLRRAQMSARPQPGPPQAVLVITARFGRLMWKYEAMTYALILKHVGVLYQTMYMVATAMGLAPCGLGSGDSALFAAATGLQPLAEGSVGEFLLGRQRQDERGAAR